MLKLSPWFPTVESGGASSNLARGAAIMWRSFFLAIGIFLCILGVECLGIEKAVLDGPGAPASGFGALGASPREIAPPEWAPWTLMSGGAVVLLYSFTIPKRMGQG
jgi:hypothetical protein